MIADAFYTSVLFWELFPFQYVGEEATREKESYRWAAENTKENQDKIKSELFGKLYMNIYIDV